MAQKFLINNKFKGWTRDFYLDIFYFFFIGLSVNSDKCSNSEFLHFQHRTYDVFILFWIFCNQENFFSFQFALLFYFISHLKNHKILEEKKRILGLFAINNFTFALNSKSHYLYLSQTFADFSCKNWSIFKNNKFH